MEPACEARVDALRDVVEFRRPLAQALAALQRFKWDAPKDSVVVMKSDVVGAIQRLETGETSATELRDWAEALEGRDDVGFEMGNVDLKQALFELATPALFGETHAVAHEWRGRLQ